MGQKIPPKALRLGYTEDWDAKWFASFREFPELLEEDYRLRQFLKNKLKYAAVSRIVIERPGNKFLRINVYTARPGIVIGRRGTDIENLRQDLERFTQRKVMVNVSEIKQAETNAQLVAENIALQIEKKIHYRRAIKRAIERAMSAGTLGIKIMVSGRLGGAEIARSEWLKKGRIPLATLRALIDLGKAAAKCTYGKVGIKVWIFKKELFKKSEKDLLEEAKLVEKEKITEVTPESESPQEETEIENKNVITEKSKVS